LEGNEGSGYWRGRAEEGCQTLLKAARLFRLFFYETLTLYDFFGLVMRTPTQAYSWPTHLASGLA
jgi:hypothetical protein